MNAVFQSLSLLLLCFDACLKIIVEAVVCFFTSQMKSISLTFYQTDLPHFISLTVTDEKITAFIFHISV